MASIVATDTASASAFTSASSSTNTIASHTASMLSEQVQTAPGGENAATMNESLAAASTTVDGSTPTDVPFDAELARLGPMPREFLDSQGITDVEGFLSRSAKSLAPALSKFLEHNAHKKLSPATTGIWISRWKRNLLQRRETLKEEGLEGLDPTFEVFDVTVRSFFASKSIVDTQGLVSCQTLVPDWAAWRHNNRLSAQNTHMVTHITSDWRQSVKEQVGADRIADALDFDELARLGTMPREFLVSEGITDVASFLPRSARSLAPALSKFLERTEQKKLSPGTTARKCISRWRRDLLQRRETLKEGSDGLDPTFEVFDVTVRSFFASKSIVDPQGLLKYKALGREWVAWRLEKHSTVVSAHSGGTVTSGWRQSVKEQLQTLVHSGATKTLNPPLKKRRLKRKVAIRTAPWLLLGASAAASQERTDTDTNVPPSGIVNVSDSHVADTECFSDNSPPAQKRARLEEAVAPTVPDHVGAFVSNHAESLVGGDQK